MHSEKFKKGCEHIMGFKFIYGDDKFKDIPYKMFELGIKRRDLVTNELTQKDISRFLKVNALSFSTYFSEYCDFFCEAYTAVLLKRPVLITPNELPEGNFSKNYVYNFLKEFVFPYPKKTKNIDEYYAKCVHRNLYEAIHDLAKNNAKVKLSDLIRHPICKSSVERLCILRLLICLCKTYRIFIINDEYFYSQGYYGVIDYVLTKMKDHFTHEEFIESSSTLFNEHSSRLINRVIKWELFLFPSVFMNRHNDFSIIDGLEKSPISIAAAKMARKLFAESRKGISLDYLRDELQKTFPVIRNKYQTKSYAKDIFTEFRLSGNQIKKRKLKAKALVKQF